MGKRISDLEEHVTDLMAHAGIENTNGDLMVRQISLQNHIVHNYAV